MPLIYRIRMLSALVLLLGATLGTAQPPIGGATLEFAEEPPTAALQVIARDKAKDAGKKPAPPTVLVELPRGDVIPGAEERPIDLPTALQLAETQNPEIALARQAISAALANQLRARALMLPTLRAGANYRLHNGLLQTSFGEMRRVNSSSFYFGSGARTIAAETIAFPGVQIFTHLGDGLLEPLVARQQVVGRNFQAAAVANATLLEVSIRFLELVAAQADLQAIRTTEKDLAQVVQITAAFAKTGNGRDADALRARTEWLLLHTEEQQAQEQVAVASNNLANVLSLDPALRLNAPAQAEALLQLVDPGLDLQNLVQLALANRPELAALGAETTRKNLQYRQEQVRPLFPTIAVNFSAGSFGGGTNRTDLVPVHPGFGRFGGRTDFDVLAFWTLQNFGVGNLALQKMRRVERDIAAVDQERMVNQIGREVASAQTQVATASRDLEIARNRLQIAEAAFKEDMIRIKGNVGLPIEVLNSVNRLARARQDLIHTVLAYNQAQVSLFVAVGQTPLAGIPPKE